MDLGLVATTFAFGLRHGIDWDHLAAIADITGSQASRRDGMRLATLYASGHAAMVLVLGIAAIYLGDLLPDPVDGLMERVVGVTLIALGAYILYALVRHGRDFRMRSRWMLVIGGARRAYRRARSIVIEHSHDHDHDRMHDHPHDRDPAAPASGARVAVATRTHRHLHRHHVADPPDPFAAPSRGAAFGIGALHGVGAETPTQLLLFVAAAGAGGRGAGVVLLVVFLAGLVATNTLIAAAASAGFLGAGRSFKIYAAVAILAGGFSLAVGALLATGRAAFLPAFFG